MARCLNLGKRIIGQKGKADTEMECLAPITGKLTNRKFRNGKRLTFPMTRGPPCYSWNAPHIFLPQGHSSTWVSNSVYPLLRKVVNFPFFFTEPRESLLYRAAVLITEITKKGDGQSIINAAHQWALKRGVAQKFPTLLSHASTSMGANYESFSGVHVAEPEPQPEPQPPKKRKPEVIDLEPEVPEVIILEPEVINEKVDKKKKRKPIEPPRDDEPAQRKKKLRLTNTGNIQIHISAPPPNHHLDGVLRPFKEVDIVEEEEHQRIVRFTNTQIHFDEKRMKRRIVEDVAVAGPSGINFQNLQ